MLFTDAPGLFIGAVALGLVHGVEPGHGWPVAASYALDRSNKWLAGLAAGLVLGVGHLVSSMAMVAVFFLATAYFDLTQVNEPMRVLGVEVGGPVSVVAGVVLVVLGVREYTHGHGGHDHSHSHGGAAQTHRDHDADGVSDRVAAQLQTTPLARPGTTAASGSPGHGHAYGGGDHSHLDVADAADRGIWGLAWVAFLLGFAHEEEFEIIALCAGSTYCLELMTAYALTVVVGIVALTLLMVAGYEHFEEEVERYVPYLPVVSAVVLVGMGLGFVFGVL